MKEVHRNNKGCNLSVGQAAWLLTQLLHNAPKFSPARSKCVAPLAHLRSVLLHLGSSSSQVVWWALYEVVMVVEVVTKSHKTMVVAKKMWGIAKKKWLVANFPVRFMASSHKKMATFYFVVGFEINWVLRFDCQFGTKDIRDRAYPDVPGKCREKLS